jgi:hypothetical protein
MRRARARFAHGAVLVRCCETEVISWTTASFVSQLVVLIGRLPSTKLTYRELRIRVGIHQRTNTFFVIE